MSYADDLQMYYSFKAKDVNCNIPLVNEDLKRISEYCKNSGLKINEGKCYYMFIGSRQSMNTINETDLMNICVNNTPIKRVAHVKNLGLTYDEILSWRKHINISIAKAMGNFICISRFKKFLSVQAKKNLCESMILSQFNYSDSVYLNIDIYLQKKIQKMQNLCIRFIFNIKKKDACDYEEYRRQLNWTDMQQTRISHSLVILYKTLKYKSPIYLSDMFTQHFEICERLTRTFGGNIWIGNSHYSVLHRKSFRIYIARIWNSLPDEIKLCGTALTFKKKIKELFLANAIALPPA